MSAGSNQSDEFSQETSHTDMQQRRVKSWEVSLQTSSSEPDGHVMVLVLETEDGEQKTYYFSASDALCLEGQMQTALDDVSDEVKDRMMDGS